MNEVRNSTKGNEHEPKLVIRKLSYTTDSSDNVEAKIAFETVDGVIVLLDALGIKGIWKRKDPAEVLGTWSLLQSEYAKGIESLRAKLRAYGDLKETKFEAFSDTIMVSLPITKREVGRDSGRNSSWWTIMLIGEWLTDIFRVSIRHNFYFRGCLSAGTFYRSENMTIGPAVDEAAEYYRLPEWSGISTCPSASKILTDAEEMKATMYDFFIHYDIPLKNVIEKNGWALNWPQSQAQDQTGKVNLRQIVYNESRRINDISGYCKIKNTLSFYDWVTSRSSL